MSGNVPWTIGCSKSKSSEQQLEDRKIIILPSSFQESHKYINQNYQKAMAIIQKSGRPNLFVTFNYNPA
jgi:hypothetical protein